MATTVFDTAGDVMLIDDDVTPQGPAPSSDGDLTSFDISLQDGILEICIVRTISSAAFSSAAIFIFGEIEAGWQLHDGSLTTWITRLGAPIPGATITADPLGRRICIRIPWDDPDADLPNLLNGWSVQSFHLQNDDGSMRSYDQYP